MKEFAHNKKATFNYEVLDKYEGGLSLLGYEVKSVKSGKVNLAGSYIIIRGGEAFLTGAEIQPYQAKNTPENYDPKRPRKILITKKELKKLEQAEQTKGLALIPVSLFNQNNKIKVSFVIGRGKRKSDKRETIREREAKIEIEREIKGRR